MKLRSGAGWRGRYRNIVFDNLWIVGSFWPWCCTGLATGWWSAKCFSWICFIRFGRLVFGGLLWRSAARFFGWRQRRRRNRKVAFNCLGDSLSVLRFRCHLGLLGFASLAAPLIGREAGLHLLTRKAMRLMWYWSLWWCFLLRQCDWWVRYWRGGGFDLTKIKVPRFKRGILRWRSVTSFPRVMTKILVPGYFDWSVLAVDHRTRVIVILF
jgi:hypothetical protein